MKKMLFVFNPNSGKGQIKNVLLSIITTFSDAGYELTVYPTKGVSDAYNFIRENEGKYDMIVCSGGDGTLNETTSAVMSFSSERPPIGYIPSGTTNDYAVSLGIPRNMKKAAEHIMTGYEKSLDVGLFNGRPFNYIAAFGAFTAVSYETPQTMKNKLGHQAYVLEAMRSLSRIPAIRMTVQHDDVEINDEFAYGMISNSKSVGGLHGLIGQSVKLSDGLFEVTLVRKPKNPIELQQLVSAFLARSFENCDMIYSFKAAKLSIATEDNISWTLDGEFGGEHRRVEFEVIPSAIRMMVKKQ